MRKRRPGEPRNTCDLGVTLSDLHAGPGVTWEARRAEEDFKKNRRKYENEEALISARVEEEEREMAAEATEESSSDETPTRIDLQQVTQDNDKVR